MDSLSTKQTPNAVRKALQTLPTGVFETYNDVIQRIEDENEDDKQLAKKTLMWLSLSLRPVTMGELQHAVTIDNSFDELDEDDILNEEIIVSVCAGLVSLAAEEGVVQLVHFTVQEYFSQTSIRETFFVHGQRKMLSSCLAYLLLDDFKDGLPENEGPELDILISKRPLFYYAAHNWGHHARAAHLEQMDQEMILRLLENELLVVSLTDALHIAHGGENRRFYPGIFVEADRQGLWLASLFGLVEIVNHLLENGVNVNSQIALKAITKNGRRSYSHSWNCESRINSVRTALTIAAWNGHVAVVRLLLDKGAKIQKLDLNGAVYNQHTKVVDLLLRHGAPLHNADEHGPRYYGAAFNYLFSFNDLSTGYSPIDWCAKWGNVGLARLLLANGANVHIQSTQYNTPLILAAENGHTATIRHLLDHNAAVNAQNTFKETAMHKASKNGHTAIVKLLLARGASFTTPDATSFERWKFQTDHPATFHSSRLHSAPLRYMGKSLDLAEYDVADGSTAFQYALKYGQNDIVKLLLEADSLSALKGKSPVPLLFAAHENRPRIFELLLQYGADINAVDRTGRTALFWAAANSSEEMTKMLLGKGLDIDVSNEDGMTPLHMAVAVQISKCSKTAY